MESAAAPGVKVARQNNSLSGKLKIREKNNLPDKKNFVGQEAVLSGNNHLPDKIRERRSVQVADKERPDVVERRGWIEYSKRGTKNPKRYAYRRRWIRAEGGSWVKSKVKRLRSIPPLTEEDYVKRITDEGRDPTTGRRKPDSRNK